MPSDPLPEKDRAMLAEELVKSLVSVSLLPGWMQAPALGRDMRPLAEHQADAIAYAIAAMLAAAWDRGYRAGSSNAMRRMSDEPNAPTSLNPYAADSEPTP